VGRRIGKPSIPGLLFYGVLVIAIIVGLLIKGDTGDTIVAIAGVILAMVVVVSIGFGKASNDWNDKRGGGASPPRL
jgi:hypothetical protein